MYLIHSFSFAHYLIIHLNDYNDVKQWGDAGNEQKLQ